MKSKQILLLVSTAILVGTSSITSYAAKNQAETLLNTKHNIVAQKTDTEGVTPMMIGQFVAAEKPTKGTATIVNEGESAIYN